MRVQEELGIIEADPCHMFSHTGLLVGANHSSLVLALSALRVSYEMKARVFTNEDLVAKYARSANGILKWVCRSLRRRMRRRC